MNPVQMILSFSPWIAFAFLAGDTMESLSLSILIAIALTLLTSYRDLRNRFILPWVTLVFFILIYIAIFFLHQVFILPYLMIVSMAALMLVGWGSIIIREPFTLQYARQGYDPERAKTPLFIRTNYLLSGMWGIAFTINMLIAVAVLFYPVIKTSGLNNVTWLVIAIALLITFWYPSYVRNHMPKPDSR